MRNFPKDHFLHLHSTLRHSVTEFTKSATTHTDAHDPPNPPDVLDAFDATD